MSVPGTWDLGPGTLWGKDSVAEGAIQAAQGDTIAVFQTRLDKCTMGNNETVLHLTLGLSREIQYA